MCASAHAYVCARKGVSLHSGIAQHPAQHPTPTNTVGACTPEHHDVQQGVGAQAVGTMHTCAGCFTRSHQARHNSIRVTTLRAHECVCVM
eukprot:1148343-Pelagomonas_calceolata.AAC.5